ncbi:uroporphyrinogen-III synthase [Salinimicrobium catena]|uniref:uroporphyrinogen-III synthase n=1 Tax=Salinimicrobium catena TaxID=390640 RepID=UPI002FE4C1ED
MKHLLSTKKLEPHQKELLLNAGFGVVEKDFISIIPLDFQLNTVPENLIFTSKNAVKAILKQPGLKELQEKKVFAVGDKTSDFLEQNGFTVSETTNYGNDLAHKIVAEHKKEKFLFFCGKKRNPDLPEKLKKNNVSMEEIEVYDTVFSSTKIDRIFDGVLFFSPSGVKSYCSQNELSNSIAFCIGNTTASEAKKRTKNIIVAAKPSIENVIVQVVKHFK